MLWLQQIPTPTTLHRITQGSLVFSPYLLLFIENVVSWTKKAPIQTQILMSKRKVCLSFKKGLSFETDRERKEPLCGKFNLLTQKKCSYYFSVEFQNEKVQYLKQWKDCGKSPERNLQTIWGWNSSLSPPSAHKLRWVKKVWHISNRTVWKSAVENSLMPTVAVSSTQSRTDPKGPNVPIRNNRLVTVPGKCFLTFLLPLPLEWMTAH